MPETVKLTRSYHSPRRREQADATRRHILGAAQRLFEQDGYPATSMGAIAKEADVSAKTVYLAFESKSGLLRALWQVVLSGQDDDYPVVARTWYREVMDEADPERQLRLNARNSRAVKERAGAMLAVIGRAAAADPDAADLWRHIQSDFHANQATIAVSLDEKNALRPGLSAGRAADILWLLNHPDQWQLLVIERGWTAAEYEEWTAAACAQLLNAQYRHSRLDA
ncbi:MAG: helix-turn-helix domain-containing protein [Actinomycetota bacterium]